MTTTSKRFENISVAETISDLLRRQSAELNAALEAIEPLCSAGEFDAYAGAIGQLMETVYTELLEPIWAEFPELCPEEVRIQTLEPSE